MLTGREAASAVAQVLPTSNSIIVSSNLGNIELRPGAIWSGNRMLVYAAPMYVNYTIGDRLYEWSTADFIRDEWFNAVGRAGASAMPMIYLAKAEMALITGLFVPWYFLLGIGVAKVGLFYYMHRNQVNIAIQQAPRILSALSYLRQNHPTLFSKLLSSTAQEVLTNLPSGITGEDIGFFIGRVLRGIGGAPELTLGVVARTVAIVAAVVSATHLPSVAAGAARTAAQRRAVQIQARLAEVGIVVSPQEAQLIVNDFIRERDAVTKLRELEAACQQLMPALNELKNFLRTSE
ncbi:MAG: hypothetical protein HC853_08755 [Anaerolineae bacterium]|nr:hypothetical protein [Anaerolineae bacterium]